MPQNEYKNDIGRLVPCEFCGAGNCFQSCPRATAKKRHDELASERVAGARDERARIVAIIDAMFGYLDARVFVDRIELKRRIGEGK